MVAAADIADACGLARLRSVHVPAGVVGNDAAAVPGAQPARTTAAASDGDVVRVRNDPDGARMTERPGEYRGGPRAPERITGPRVPAAPPEQHRTPAEISMVQEIVEAVAAQVMLQSRTSMRRETRPLKLSIAGLGAMLVATCGWGVSQISGWQESQRNQWAVEAKQAEQDVAMSEHLAEPHVTPEQIAALQGQMAALSATCAEALARAPAATLTTKRGR